MSEVRQRGHLACALLLASLLGACPEQTNERECAELCERLDECGLLPSVLGADIGGADKRKNCESRCQLSTDSRSSRVRNCADAGAPPSAAEGGDREQQCASLAGCLEVAVPDASILGEATLIARPALADNAPDTQCPLPDASASCPYWLYPDSPGCRADCNAICGGFPFAEQTAKLWCETIGAARGVPFVVRRGEYDYGAERSCAELLQLPERFEHLEPGSVQAGIELWGTSSPDPEADAGGATGAADAGAAPTPAFCYVFYGSAETLAAGVPATSAIAVPEPALLQCLSSDKLVFTCERDGVACADGLDNDGNGFADCADAKCGCSTPTNTPPAPPDSGPATEAGEP